MVTHDVDEADIRHVIDALIDAICAMDLEALKQIYTPDIVTFDVGGPLQRSGTEAKLGNWVEAFAAFQSPLGYEIRDLAITSSGEVGFAHSLARLSGTLKNGTASAGFWVRLTACLRKIDDHWLIAHDHVSVPVDPASGKATLTRELPDSP
ncbi:MAG: nuclear transport factor 2 family protein [Actinobacteria bacterium]|nr:nuclear transport factor 2 family protein [Actinomycetota bacterium]